MRRSFASVFVLATVVTLCVAVPGVAVASEPAASIQTGDVATVRQPPAKTFDADHARRLEDERRREELAAQVAVPLVVDWFVVYQYEGDWWIDGHVSLPGGSPSNVAGVLVNVELHSATDVPLDSAQTYGQAWVLAPTDGTVFSVHAPDPGTGHFEVPSASGWATSMGPVALYIDLSLTTVGWGPLNERWNTLHVVNTNPFTVVAAQVTAYETFTPTLGTAQNWDVPWSEDHQQRLAPGESVDVTIWGDRAPSGAGSFTTWVAADAVQAPPTQAVYRFYNRQTGTHFFTIDPVERDNVINTLGWRFTYEGEAYRAYREEDFNTTALERFYNVRTGTHFYTADPDEAAYVQANLGGIYQYEGTAYWICDSGGLATNAAYRFYNRRAGVHFYTIDPAERDNVINTLGWLYTFEGPAFSVPKP